ncbi:ABC transporter permease [Methanonatronarchaeum sp. AMET-Sl]|uniref:ABC transporter permease n=1 Tax=Methanonatronarchaeum sp. AMET-Sl TaxID=3037654 RepID=UPI00244E1332|nr:ABC transporter permease [Methanonatronarchaeum sp. AMET-Sl]WGI17812.1 ABC transporter permease [Methanonatronarchaeum sp. AMET-Sl]
METLLIMLEAFLSQQTLVFYEYLGLTTVQNPFLIIDSTSVLELIGIEFPFELNYITSIIYVSLYVSLTAVFLSTIFSIPVAMLIGFTDFPGKQLIVSVINTGMGFPSVVVGLVVLFAVSNQGPLGTFDLMFTKEAMIISQFVLATPVITGIALSSVMGVRDGVRDAAYVMGGTKLDVSLVTIKEARTGIITAVLAGLGRAVSEVGSVLIVGGNIAGYDGTSITRTLTTAIQLEARQGRFETALLLGGILVALVLLINGVLIRLGYNRISGGEDKWHH